MLKIIQIFKCKKQVTGVAPIINTSDDNWELINISSSEEGGSSIEISQDIETDKLSTDKVPSTKAVYDFMSWVPKDIITNQEFNTGKTIDGKPIYGMYVHNNVGVDLSELNLIYATAYNYEYVDPLHQENNKNLLYIFSENYRGIGIIKYELPYISGGIVNSSNPSNLNNFIGFVFYTKTNQA